jgi:yecA family protein
MAAMTTVVARFNVISEALSVAPRQHAPLFGKTDDDLVRPHPWCMSFLKAMRLRFNDWKPLLDFGRFDHGLMLPILLCPAPPLAPPTG